MGTIGRNKLIEVKLSFFSGAKFTWPLDSANGFFVRKNLDLILSMKKIKLNSKQDLMSAITSNREVIKGYGVSKIGFFGSFSRGTFSETSDIDLLVDFVPGKKTFDNFMELSFFLEELLGRKVELVTPQSLSEFIGPYILKEVENVSLES